MHMAFQCGDEVKVERKSRSIIILFISKSRFCYVICRMFPRTYREPCSCELRESYHARQEALDTAVFTTEERI